MATVTTKIPVRGWHLTNTQPGHNKFYTVLVSDNGVVTTSWGRIGTAGQSKVQKFPHLADAVDVGLRQLYTKKAGGYEPQIEDFTFMVGVNILEDACEQNDASILNRALHQAHKDQPSDGGKEAVFQHYQSFRDQAQTLLDRQGEVDLADLFVEYEQVKAAWDEIEAVHDETATTMKLVESMLHTALLGRK